MSNEIVNRVAQSNIEQIDLSKLAPPDELVVFDLKDWLFQGLILKEADFKDKVKNHDWAQYSNKNVTIDCSTDAIIPSWAFMTIASKLEPVASRVLFGNRDAALQIIFHDELKKINPADYKDKPVVIKGCGDKEVPVSAFVEIICLVQPYAKSIMYGEPCSTVPVYKKPKN